MVYKKKRLYLKTFNKLDSLKQRLIALQVKHLFGSKDNQISLEKNEVILLCLVKNGEPYIDEFLSYHTKLGIKHFVFLDNGSTDNTINLLKKLSKNITVLQTNFPFRNNNDMLMRNYLLERFGKFRWSLTLDIDEFWDYPYSDKISLKELIDYLNFNEYTAVTSQMLDMFPQKISPSKEIIFKRKNQPYYDISNIDEKSFFLFSGTLSNKKINSYWGGIRKTLFNAYPCLTKHPLLFYDQNTKRARYGHLLESGHVADFIGVIFHYKFLNNFHQIVKEAVIKEHHYNKSEEYKKYYKKIKNKKEFVFLTKNTQKLKGTNELLNKSFLIISQKYKNYFNL